MSQSAVRYEKDADGVVVLTLDDPGASANTMNQRYVDAMDEVLTRLYAEKGAVSGVIVTSAKSTFFAGADLTEVIKATKADGPAIFQGVERIKAQLRRLENLGKPVVAAINGSALGGGYEIALACHHRIAVDDNRTEIGLPEVTLGLLPGGGGVTRTVRMFGLQDALMNVLLQGPRMKPARALGVGLVDELVASKDDLITAARAWLEDNRDNPKAATQPWDREGYRMPGGTPSSPKLAAFLPAFPANLRKQLKGAGYPAPRAIMAAAIEGAQVDFDTASRIESRYLVDLVTGQVSTNMIQAFFFDLQAVNGGRSRPDGFEKFSARRVGILGAGMMGAGIAYECARAGMDVVLKDVSVDAAEKGKSYSQKLLDKQVERGRSTTDKRDRTLARITPTADPNDLAGCDLVIEAVFESTALKHQVLAEIQDVVEPDALLCSNTSTLPITGLARGVKRQGDFIGLHFFSPVDKMALVEIIVGEQTSDETLARAYDVVRQIRKTPIVVNDSRGFFTSRVFGTLIMEGETMLAEGIEPATIERAATQMGFPAPPLAMQDEVSLSLSQKVSAETRKAQGDGAFAGPAMAVVDKMVDEFGRAGKAAGAGFYDYPGEGKKVLWPGLWEHFVKREVNPVSDETFHDLQERFTFAMAIESVKCVEEGVIRSTPDANIGSILGIGFPPMYGGVLQYINNYDGAGVASFEARARELAETYGDRFTPPALLVEKAKAGERF